MAYQHLTIEEREKIQEMLWQKSSIRTIAAILGRNPSSISREVRKNFVPHGKRYLPRFAHVRALEYRKHRGRNDRLKNNHIRSYVVSHLKRRWSPEQINHWIKEENSDWQTLERITGTRCFFAHAYHFWERGTNENTNGLIRDYFPKKTDFTTIPEEELAFVETELNSRPRKRLSWLIPLEVFSVALRG